MKRLARPLALLLSVVLVQAKQDPVVCGTGGADSAWLRLQLHVNAAKARQKRSPQALATAALPDNGQIAILDDTDGVVARRNDFNLNRKTVRFLPSAPAAYRVETGGDTYDASAASSGTLVSGIGDDDSRDLDLPFSFPFFGTSYTKISLNSDGNLTFGGGDAGSGERSLGRMTAGPARIAPLFQDLDPTQSRDGVHILSTPSRFVVSWSQVPEYSDFNGGVVCTFQVRMFPDGKIEFAYSNFLSTAAVVGIAPGRLKGATTIVDFAVGSAQEFSGAIAERFLDLEEVDIYTAAQKFYQNHEDAYDYLVLYNNQGIPASSGAVAYEVTVRNNRSGFGDIQVDLGFEAGSKRRLQAILNMGPLSQYPTDPNAVVPARSAARDTPLTVLGHEAGHLFLAFASVRNPGDPESQPMLGRSLVHWNFSFNSEASLLEGNRIRDNGPGATPRFTTIATVEGYAPLDQYLMGFRAAQDVPATFLVQNSTITDSGRSPQSGVNFNGTRRDIQIDEVIQAEGRRTPDYTVAQRKFRFAFAMVTKAGTAPTTAELQKIETYRQQFESFYNRASSQNASAETTLKKALRVSTFPAAGVLLGNAGTGKIAVETPVATPLTLVLRSQTGALGLPTSVTIPANASEVSFPINGLREGVDEFTAEAADTQYEVVTSRIQIAPPSTVKLTITSGGNQVAVSGTALAQPVSVRVTDINNLPYPGVIVQSSVSAGGTLTAPTSITDETGTAQFRWIPGSSALNELRASIANGASVTTSALGNPSITAATIVNAASFTAGISPGSIATVFGTNLTSANLSDVKVFVNSIAAQVFYIDNRQINFLVPSGLTGTSAEIRVTTPVGSSSATVPLAVAAPGIFFDTASSFGAVLTSGTGLLTTQRPPAPGDVIEIYATGLGPLQALSGGVQRTSLPTQVNIGGASANVLFSGLAPGFPGLYQVNAQIPQRTPNGPQTLSLNVNGVKSNEVKIQVK